MYFDRICAAAFALWPMLATAQVKVQFQLQSQADTANYYVAGSFNGWQPNDAESRFDQRGRLTKTVAKGSVQSFKITRGSWQTVECRSSGADVDNRVFIASSDTILLLKVEAWKDAFAPAIKRHTASVNVRLYDSTFSMIPLDRRRSISVYLPPNYDAQPNKRYPVLYLQDGQNCFDSYNAAFGEWEVDETLDRYYTKLRRSMIVVAIDNGGNQRLTEYNPYNHAKFGKGEGQQYAQFLAKTLKPQIDAKYRTLSNKANTHVAGSSMGALISCWTVLQYPELFGSAGIFSPAFWVAPQLAQDIAKRAKGYKGKLFFYAGGKESASMVPDMDAVVNAFKRVSTADVKRLVSAPGQHNEKSWRQHFVDYIKFIL